MAIATVLSPVIAEAALHLGPWEYFSLCFCAITLIASLSKGNIFKGIMSAGIGLLMGCIGMDPINGATRFTFGNVYLTSGISTVAQMLGMFAMCQIIRDNAKGEAKMPDVDVKNMKGLGIGFKDIIENIKTIIFAFAFRSVDRLLARHGLPASPTWSPMAMPRASARSLRPSVRATPPVCGLLKPQTTLLWAVPSSP